MAPSPLWQHNKEEEEEMESEERESIRGSHLCIPVDTHQEQCHYDALTHTHTPVMHKHTHTLKSLSNTLFHLAHPFDYALTIFSDRHRVQFEFITLNVNIGATAAADRYSLLNERACCQEV